MPHSTEELLSISPAVTGMKPLPLAPGRGKELFLLKERFSRLLP